MGYEMVWPRISGVECMAYDGIVWSLCYTIV